MDPIELTRIIVLVIMLATTVYTDARFGKIFNKVVLPCIPIGLLLWGIGDGWRGVESGLIGLGIGSIALIFAGVLSWIAPGDAKLVMAVGALMGGTYTASAMTFGAVAGGALALTVMLKRHLLKEWATGTAAAWISHLPISTFWLNRAGYIPYSIPIAVGCVFAGLYPLW